MRKIEPIRTINLSATILLWVLSIMNLWKRTKRGRTSFNLLNTFSQQTHNKLEFFCLSDQLLFVVLLFRCGGKADGQGLVAAHCKLCLGCVRMVVEVMMMMITTATTTTTTTTTTTMMIKIMTTTTTMMMMMMMMMMILVVVVVVVVMMMMMTTATTTTTTTTTMMMMTMMTMMMEMQHMGNKQ